MAFHENGERIDDLKFIVSQVSKVCTKFDDDGILIRFLNYTKDESEFDGIKSESGALKAIDKVTFSGGTPLGSGIDRIYDKIIKPMAKSNNLKKPVMVIIVTDGEPDNKLNVKNTIKSIKKDMTKTKYNDHAMCFQFAQVGKDKKAQDYLAELDNDKEIGDIIDCTSNYEMEEEEYKRKGLQLTPYLWLLKVCLGAIDKSYDEQDEQ